MSGPRQGLVAGWNRFWFEPEATSTLALFRIGFGLVAFFWTFSLIPNLTAFYGSDGIMPGYPVQEPGSWGVLALSGSHSLLVAVFLVTLMAAAALTLGLFSRIAAVLVWLGVMAFQHRNPLVGNSGDEMVGNFALFCALAPSGAALSVDRLRTAPARFWEFPDRAPWALRLVQVQLSVTYLSSFWQQIQGERWRDGTAVSYALRVSDVHRVPTPDFITHSVPLTEILTFGTLGLEAALGILVWNRATRPWVLAAGIVMHLGIDVSLLVGYSSLVMIVGYVAFVPADTSARWIRATRDRFSRRGRRGSTARAVLGPGEEQPPEKQPREGDDAVGLDAAGSEVPIYTIRDLMTGRLESEPDLPETRSAGEPPREPTGEGTASPSPPCSPSSPSSWEAMVVERRRTGE